jgi:hypothetical protein
VSLAEALAGGGDACNAYETGLRLREKGKGGHCIFAFCSPILAKEGRGVKGVVFFGKIRLQPAVPAINTPDQYDIKNREAGLKFSALVGTII